MIDLRMQRGQLFGIFLTEELKAFKLEEVYFAFIALGVEEGLLEPVWAMPEARQRINNSPWEAC